jgi:phospholipid/cholesterol/gamma-HCH transport system permease protein
MSGTTDSGNRGAGATAGVGSALERAAEDSLLLRVWGPWTLDSERPEMEGFERELASAASGPRLAVDAHGVTAWDSSLPAFLRKLSEVCSRRDLVLDLSGVPEGARRLLSLAPALPERQATQRGTREPLLASFGERVSALASDLGDVLTFTGEVVLSGFRAALGRARFEISDLLLFTQQAGASALPIVSLISALVGVILGFVGAAELRMFGAEMYVADLVGIGMIRELGAMMTGIIMAGRTGSAYAAQLGTMAVNEEIDALRTFGIDPVELLVLPRVLALAVMLPLLCVYADLLGLAGGALVGVGSFGISLAQYADRTRGALSLRHFEVGIVKSALHWVRDVTFDEDRCRARAGHAAQLLACLRNLAISLLRLADAHNIADARRNLGACPALALRLFGL